MLLTSRVVKIDPKNYHLATFTRVRSESLMQLLCDNKQRSIAGAKREELGTCFNRQYNRIFSLERSNRTND